MRGVFAVEEPTGERWEIALDLLRRGEAFSMGRITFRRRDSSTVEAAVASSWLAENVTEQYAVGELREARDEVEQLRAADPGFKEAVGESAFDYVLIDDYDTGSVALCRLAGGDEVDWLTPRPSSG